MSAATEAFSGELASHFALESLTGRNAPSRCSNGRESF